MEKDTDNDWALALPNRLERRSKAAFRLLGKLTKVANNLSFNQTDQVLSLDVNTSLGIVHVIIYYAGTILTIDSISEPYEGTKNAYVLYRQRHEATGTQAV
jgi:hypothetical protein